jgi:hypothetical protein
MAFRLIFESDGGHVRLLRKNRVDMVAPAQAAETSRTAVGVFAEVRDDADETIYQIGMSPQLDPTREVFSPNAQVQLDQLRGAINIHRVNVVSTESGAIDLCSGSQRATFFASNFCEGGIDRLLVSDTGLAIEVGIEAVPEMNATLMLVNSSMYGGSGGTVPVFSLAEGAFEIALHEMGHSHFGLADEYPYLQDCHEDGHGRYRGTEPAEPNVTANIDALKWSHLITDGIPLPTTKNLNCDDCDDQPNPLPDESVGAYEGARYFRCGIFRPQYACRMRSLGAPFCAVCQETISRVLTPFLPKKRRSVRK